MIDAWRGKWAVVTGASAGIGWAFAEQLAAGGAHLVLTARRPERLEELARKLESSHDVNVECFPADLQDPRAREALFAFTEKRGVTVDLLINNAGYGTYGEFYKSDLERELGMLQLNCAAVVHLTHLFLPGMIERRTGDILIVASTAGFQPVAYIATYAATKAFDLLFAEALAEEVARYSIRVCALCPGPTKSEFHQVAGVPLHGSPKGVQSADKVVALGLKALAEGKYSVISGLVNQLSVQAQRIAPRRFVTGAAEKVMRPQYLRKR